MSIVELRQDTAPDAPFVTGDVVQLRSGGWTMTVRKVVKSKDATKVTVDWMDAAGNACAADYDPRQLQAPLDGEMSSEDD